MKKRKILSFLIAALIVLSTFTAAGLTAEAKDIFGGVADFFGGAFADLREKLTAANDYPDPVPKTQIGDSSTYWEYADGVLTISGTGAMPDFSSPWYDIRDDITSVVICDGVTSIGVLAFDSCDSLTSITLPEGLTTIGEWAFAYCLSLASVTFPDGLTTIGTYAFCNCDSLASVSFPEGLTSIGNYAFLNCESLASVSFPEGLTSIGDCAFWYCESLASVILPKSLSSLGSAAFTNLDSVSVAEGNETYHSAGNCVIETAAKILVLGTNNSVIPSDGSVTSIGNDAFACCVSLTSVSFPEGLTSIGNDAFAYCDSLASVTFPEGLKEIGAGAFYDCDSLASVTFPEGLTSIGNFAFYSCDSLASVSFPEGLTSIGDCAFWYCDSLASVVLPKSLSSLGSEAFTNLDSVSVAEGNETYHSAGNCVIETAAKILVLGTNNSVVPSDGSVTAVGAHAFYNCFSLASVTFPEGLTSIGYEAFYSCDSLASVTLPEGLTSIGSDAFYSCDSLASVSFPEGLTTIGNYAFYSCDSLASVTLPEGLTTIGNYAFEHCDALTSVTCWAKIPPETGTSVFYGCSSNLKIYVPEESIDAYKLAWSDNADRIFAIGGGDDSEFAINTATMHQFIADIWLERWEKYGLEDSVSGLTAMIDYYANCRSYMQIQCDQIRDDKVLNAEILAWKAVNFPSDPSGTLYDVMSETSLYEAILMELLRELLKDNLFQEWVVQKVQDSTDATEEMINQYLRNKGINPDGTVDEGVFKEAVSKFKDLFDYVLDIADTVKDTAEMAKRVDLVQIFGTDFGVTDSKTIETWLKNWSEKSNVFHTMDESLTLLHDIKFVFSQGVIVNDLMKKLVTFNELRGLGTQYFEFLNVMANNTNDTAIRFAIQKLLGCLQNDTILWESLMIDLLTKESTEIFGLVWKEFKECVGKSIPYLNAILLAYDITSTILDLSFKTGDKLEKLAESLAFSDLYDVIQDSYYVCKNKYLQNSTKENAALYLAGVDMLFVAAIADCDYAVDYLDEIEKGGFTMLLVSKETEDELNHTKEMIKSMKKTRNDRYQQLYQLAFVLMKETGFAEKSIYYDDSLPEIKNHTSGTCGDHLYWDMDEKGNMIVYGYGGMGGRGGGSWLSLTSETNSYPWEEISSSIHSVYFDFGITHIGENAFSQCENIKGSVTIPSSVTSIGKKAFYGCKKIDTVIVFAAEPPTVGEDAFDNCSKDLEIHVPETAGEAYKEAWKDYAEQIVADEEPPTPQYEKGDVNGDGEVTITDYLMIKAHVLGTKEFDAEIVARMNVNGDKDDKGKDVINIADYLLVKKFVLEK